MERYRWPWAFYEYVKYMVMNWSYKDKGKLLKAP